ncbi:hypothetical protein [Brazilian marseillevirus]|uniref:hypothetical protein n=1 Tax=Brazilian marseillevirus TaxID=1813599 RepID=UPI0007848FB0|nr:hypothetical protein A3303_gp137 [Brazilian marseillevirus]AMQ10645.1 hypothetical protein [Brazilian marseillevirus]
MDALVSVTFGSSLTLGVVGLSMLHWKKTFFRIIPRVSGSRLVQVTSGTTKTFALKSGGEVQVVKSLGFKGKSSRKDYTSVKALVGNSHNLPPFSGETVEVKESDEPIYIYEGKEESVATDNSEALERYIRAVKRNEENGEKNFLEGVAVVSLLSSQGLAYAGIGLVVFDTLAKL